jgi:biopolymer transport protein ExbB
MQLSRLFVAAGIVAWPLLMFSILSLTLIAERSLFWFRIWKRQDPLIQQVLKRLPSDWYAAIKLLQKNTDLPMARIFLAALELDRGNSEEFRLALEGAAQAELPTLRRFSTVLDTIVAVAPLLGLLGTVLGLMAAFAGLQVGDVAGDKTAAVKGGISEALASTVLGLVVAILTMLFTNTFRGLYRRQVALIQEYGNRLELLYRRSQMTDNRKHYPLPEKSE